MSMNRFGTTVRVGVCVLALCVFGGLCVFDDRSFSADTVISVPPAPGGPPADGEDAASDVANPFIKEISHSADPSKAMTNLQVGPSYLPPIYMHFLVNNEARKNAEVVEVRAGVKVEISYAFGDPTAGYTTQGDRFVVVHTPWGDWFSFRGGSVIEGIQGDLFTVSKDRITEEVLNISLLGLPFGAYTFYLAFDENPDGEVDYGSLEYTYVVLKLRHPLDVKLTASPMSGPAPLQVTYQVIMHDPNDAEGICTLILDAGAFPCSYSGNTHTYTKEGPHPARVEVTDIYYRPVLSNIVTIFVEPPANSPPTVSNLSVSPSEVDSYEDSFTIYYEYSDPDGLDDVITHHITIGSWSKTYEAGGSGKYQNSYNFGPGTTPGYHLIEVYVIDSAGNQSNKLVDGIIFNEQKPCGTFVEEGSDTPEEHWVELGQSSGHVWFDYETYDQEDRILVWYEGIKKVDTGCVGTNGTRSTSFTYSGTSTQVEVWVTPNCAGGTGTKWWFRVNCPIDY